MLFHAGFRCRNSNDRAPGRPKDLRKDSRQSTLSDYGTCGKMENDLKNRFNDALGDLLELALLLSLVLFFLGVLAVITWGLRVNL